MENALAMARGNTIVQTAWIIAGKQPSWYDDWLNAMRNIQL
jgi:hypothetical protein